MQQQYTHGAANRFSFEIGLISSILIHALFCFMLFLMLDTTKKQKKEHTVTMTLTAMATPESNVGEKKEMPPVKKQVHKIKKTDTPLSKKSEIRQQKKAQKQPQSQKNSLISPEQLMPKAIDASTSKTTEIHSADSNTKSREQKQTGQNEKKQPPATQGLNVNTYLAKLRKKLQENLIYPVQARRIGMEGTTTIRFTVEPSGAIQDDSLKIVRSSGSSLLDARALQTARECAPFEKPPHELDISIGVSFSLKRYSSSL